MNTDTNSSLNDYQEWETLYKIAGSAALLMVGFIPIQILVFVIWPPPGTVVGWFTLFQNSKLVGLVDMDLLLIVDQILMSFIFLALYVALRRTNRSVMTIALALGMLGIAIYFASTVAFEMLSLSSQYAVAKTDAERSLMIAAGQGMLVTWQGTAFDLGYVIEGIALLMIALVMRRSTAFSRATARVGILLGILSLIPPTVGLVGLFFAFGSLVPLVIWDIMIARRFLQLAKK